MRVLFISRYVPWPLHNGGAVRTFALVRGLSIRHEVTLAMSDPGDDALKEAVAAAYASLVREIVWVPVPLGDQPRPSERHSAVVRALLSLIDLFTHWLPLSFREGSTHWQPILEQLAPRFDAVFCRYAWLAPALFNVGLRRVVFDLDDVQFLFHWRELKKQATPLQRVRGTAEVFRAWLTEQLLGLRSAQVLTCSQEDADRFISRRKSVVPNGMTIEPGVSTPKSPDTVLFVGYCGWGPNRHGLEWFIRQVWPLVLTQRPTARLLVVGREANLTMLPFADHAQIELIADVPSVKPWYETAIVSIAPIFFAGGTRIKLVESLGYGTPVVATTVGAAGLTEVFDQSTGLFVVDGASAMASALCRVLADPTAATASAHRGAAVVAARYTWETLVQPVADALERWTAPGRPTR